MWIAIWPIAIKKLILEKLKQWSDGVKTLNTLLITFSYSFYYKVSIFSAEATIDFLFFVPFHDLLPKFTEQPGLILIINF